MTSEIKASAAQIETLFEMGNKRSSTSDSPTYAASTLSTGTRSVPAASPVKPKVGMTARFYGEGIGRPVRGLFLAGKRVFYRTGEEDQGEQMPTKLKSQRDAIQSVPVTPKLSRATKWLRLERLVRAHPRTETSMDQHLTPELAAEIAAADERYERAPCLECGANDPKEAERMCICSGDKDDCHGCHLWPDAP